MSLQQLLRPQSIAVVGASDRTFVGQVALQNCLRRDYAGGLYPVSRRGGTIAGLPAVSGLHELDTVPDAVVVQLRAEAVLDVVHDALRMGVRGIIIPGAGHADSGAHADTLRNGLVELRRQYEFDVVGPNCMGVLDLVTGAAPYVGTVDSHLPRGSVALVAQSGAVAEAFVNTGGRVALSTVVSSGSETITRLADYVDFFAHDEETSAVLLFVETMSDAPAILSAVRRCSAAGKPVAACIVGRSDAGREGITAHSGKLAPPARVTRAALTQAGAIIADDLDELMALGEMFSARWAIPTGNRMHVVTNSGGEGNLLTDVAAESGLELPAMSMSATQRLSAQWVNFGVRNPLDPWGADDYEAIFPAALRVAAEEPGDMLVVAMDHHRASGDHERQLGVDLARYLVDATKGTAKLPLLISPLSDEVDPELADYCRTEGLPLLRGLRPALTVLGRLVEWAAARSPLNEPKSSETAPAVDHGHTVVAAGGALSEDESLAILGRVGVRTPRRFSASDPEEAAQMAREMASAVVLKGVASNILHKTELGLVSIAPPDVAEAARQMRSATGIADLRYLVAEFVTGQLEVYVGYKRDTTFGHTFIVGLGGVWAEFLDTASVHVGPLTLGAARRFVGQSIVGEMMAKARGGRLHSDGVVDAIVALNVIAEANPHIVGIDVNPLVVGRDHATAVDAAIEFQNVNTRNAKEVMV